MTSPKRGRVDVKNGNGLFMLGYLGLTAERRGLFRWKTYLTPLGLAVRAHLKEMADD